VTLAAEMLVLAGLASDTRDAETRARGALASGAGVEKFRQMVAQQGGDERVVDDYSLLPLASGSHLVPAPREGHLASLDAYLIGRASMRLGAGRETAGDRIDPGVGIILRAKPGDRLDEGEPVLELRYRDERRLAAAVDLCARAVEIGDAPPAPRPLVIHQVTA
jgi:pyrimidine-nucleoside phosphorylase